MAGEEGPDRNKHDSAKEFCANHLKTVVTLVMIFGTILCIVLIVMVHKWRYDNNKAEEIAACLDVAVIGAGITGSYASWRMRHDSKSKIHLFEMSSRVGGRIQTERFPDLEEHGDLLNAELGAVYYLPQRHPLLNRTIHALNLTPAEYSPRNQDPPTFYFRGSHLRTSDFLRPSSVDRVPYKLHPRERLKTPDQLKRYYTEQFLSEIHTNPLGTSYNGNTNVYEMGYWSFLNSVASREGFNLIQDGSVRRSHVSNGNAALLASLDLQTWDRLYTLSEGMDALPKRLVAEFANSSELHKVHFNRRLTCVQRERGGYFTLIFQHTVTSNGITKTLPESEKVCARKLILAVSPSTLKTVKIKNLKDYPSPEALVDQYLQSVAAVSMYFLYNTTFWTGYSPPHDDVVTDLPVRRVRYVGSGRRRPGGGKHYLFMVGCPDQDDVEYFEPIIKASRDNSLLHSDCNLTMQALEDLKTQVAKAQDVSVSAMKDPIRVLLKDWREEPFHGGWHMWKRGVHWDEAGARLRELFPNAYLVGSDVCPGTCQYWIEGALETVETLLNINFPKSYIAPFEYMPTMPSEPEVISNTIQSSA